MRYVGIYSLSFTAAIVIGTVTCGPPPPEATQQDPLIRQSSAVDSSPDSTDSRSIDSLIRVEEPSPHQVVTSPLRFGGMARGYYYFEADFPVRMEDQDGTTLGSGRAQAGSDWMTEDWVPFTGSLEFAPPKSETGYLVFERANPSGLPENARSYRLPVRFQPR